MRRSFIVVAAILFTAVLSLCSTGGAGADVSIAGSKTSDLYLRSSAPTPGQLERQFAALWNRDVPTSAKLEISYRGDTPKVRELVSKELTYSEAFNLLPAHGRAVGTPRITGNRMSMAGSVVMLGVPAQTKRYHYIRDGGLWKIDWKATCADWKCEGNPDFGY